MVFTFSHNHIGMMILSDRTDPVPDTPGFLSTTIQPRFVNTTLLTESLSRENTRETGEIQLITPEKEDFILWTE